MKKFMLIFLLGVIPALSFAQSQDDIIGVWVNPIGSGKIKIFRTGEYYFGNLIWIDKPNDANGKPRLDDKNPDASKRDRKIQGLLMLTGFVWDADEKHWHKGEIYDPKSGNTYSCKMTMKNKNELDIRGYIGISLIGRSETWKRVE